MIDHDEDIESVEILGGRYTLGERIGGGSSATVYQANDRRTGGLVAVKVLDPENAVAETEVKRFVQEAQLAAQIRHPNLVPAYDFGGIGGRYYIVMELVQGKNLAALLITEKQFEPRRGASLILDVLDGLAALHECGIAHRDVSPTNVLVESVAGRERGRLGDYGLAKKLTERDLALTDVPPTKPVTMWGTHGYIAPECVRGYPNDRVSDIYSVGAVWYKMATGFPPASLRDDEPGEWPTLVHNLDDMPAAMRAVLLGALAARDQRHHSAASMAAALRAALQVPPPLVRPRQSVLARALAPALAALLAVQYWVNTRPVVTDATERPEQLANDARTEPLEQLAEREQLARAERPEQLAERPEQLAERPEQLADAARAEPLTDADAKLAPVDPADAQRDARNTAAAVPRARRRPLKSALATCKPANVEALEVVLDPTGEIEIDGGAPFGDLGRCVLREAAKYPAPSKRTSLTL